MIEIRSPEEIEKIKKAGKIVSEALAALTNSALPGVTTKELDRIAEEIIKRRNGLPAFKGFKGYPNATCTSINDSIVHEIPSTKRILKKGDIISIDVGVGCDGYFADGAITLGIGKISIEADKLIEITKKALFLAIEEAKEGNRVSDLSNAIQTFVESNGFNVVRAFVGHGIGRELHEEPEIPNFGQSDEGPRLKEGMVLAIEPMVSAGGSEIKVLSDGWTAVTKDGSLSAHFEHTVAVGKNRAEILT